jgi:hypothetical protein
MTARPGAPEIPRQHGGRPSFSSRSISTANGQIATVGATRRRWPLPRRRWAAVRSTRCSHRVLRTGPTALAWPEHWRYRRPTGLRCPHSGKRRFTEPVHAYSCAEHTATAFWSARACKLPQKWTPTQPRNLRQFRQFGESLIRERTATFRRDRNTCSRASRTASIARLAGTISGTIKTRSPVA